jgi:hypothetical protein
LNQSFRAVIDAYKPKVVQYNPMPQGSGFELTGLLQAQENLLRFLQEHLDDCYLILKSLIDPAKAKSKSKFASQYLDTTDLPWAKSFIHATAEYKHSLDIANKLKHQQGRLRGIGVESGGLVRLGYFLEEHHGAGVIGPSREIHPNGGAFSFARDLPLRLFHVYACSEKLVRAIERAMKALNQSEVVRAA